MIGIATLETPRLRLRAFHRDDFPAYAAMWAEPAVVRFIGGEALSHKAAWARFLRLFGMWHVMGFGFWAVEDRHSGALIGQAGFHDVQRGLQPSLDGTLEAGWVLATAMHGRGLAEEAMRAALAWADVRHPAARITCMIQTDHAASLHVAGKLGFAAFADTAYHGVDMVLLERRVAGGP